jgi:hypothetical protein
MEADLVTVQGSIEFRDVVMTRDRQEPDQPIYVRLHGFEAPTYRIIARHVDQFQKITLDDLFGSHYPPVYMEDFAQALIGAEGSGPKVDIFTLRSPR